MPKFVFLWTDIFIFMLVAGMLGYGWRIRGSASLRSAWGSVARTPSAMCAAVVLAGFAIIGVLDSVHYRPLLPPVPVNGSQAQASAAIYSPVLRSALDDLLSLTRLAQREKTYSSPLAIRQFVKETEIIDGRPVRDFPRLKHAGLLLDSPADHVANVYERLLRGIAAGLGASALAALLLTLCHLGRRRSLARAASSWWRGESGVP